jgi:hypothetical protein
MNRAGGGRPSEPLQIVTLPLWRLRLVREAPRFLLYGLSLAGIAASARFALLPPRAPASPASSPAPATVDRAAEGYATLFARRYLAWSAAEPQLAARSLAGFTGPELEPADGFIPPRTGSQQVRWAEVVQSRRAAPGERVFTVAAQTDYGLVYLTVGVARTTGGSLALDGYPAFVGPPVSSQAEPPHLRDVEDDGLRTVIARALRNYLAGSAAELAADLAPGSRVSLPTLGLTLLTVQRVDWAPEGSAVVAVVTAQDARGAQYTLEYELDVEVKQGRWEVSAVQTDPNA